MLSGKYLQVDKTSRNSMRLIYEEYMDSKNKSAKPNRRINYINIKSNSYKKILRFKNSKKLVSDKKWNKDTSFVIEPLYASLLKRSYDKQEYTFNECLYFIYRILYFNKNNCCVLKFKRTKINGDRSVLKSYGSCSFETCSDYIFTAKLLQNGGYEVQVETDLKSLFHTCFCNNEGKPEIIQKTTQVRGPLRDLFKDMLKGSKVYKLRNELLQKTSKLLLRAGTSEVPSDSVMRQIKTEGNFSNRDPYQEIEEYKEKSKFIVHYSKEPSFTIYLRSETLVKIAARQAANVSYFDASGKLGGHPEEFLNMARRRKGEDTVTYKKILFYVFIMKVCGNLLPIATLITDDHTAENIGFFLKELREFCVQMDIWPIVKKIMVDFSTAMLVAVNFGFNGLCNTLEYLNKMYPLMENNKNVEKDFVVVQGCCAHFAKIVSRDLDRYSTVKKVDISKSKKLIQECMALATTLYETEDIWNWWTNFIIVFGSIYYTSHVQDAILHLHTLIESRKIDLSQDKEVKFSESCATSGEKVIYKNSPFYKKAIKIFNTKRRLLALKEKKLNPWYVKGLVIHYAIKYMFNLPLWTNYFGHRIDPECEKDSNQSAEALFNIIKNNQGDGESHVRPAKLVSIFEDVTEGGIIKCENSSIGVVSSSGVVEKKIERNGTPTSRNKKNNKTTPSSSHSSASRSASRQSNKRKIELEYEGNILVNDELKSREGWTSKEDQKQQTYYDAKRLRRFANTIKNSTQGKQFIHKINLFFFVFYFRSLNYLDFSIYVI